MAEDSLKDFQILGDTESHRQFIHMSTCKEAFIYSY